MKVSLNTIKEYTDVDVTTDELVQKINQQLGGVEEVIDLGAKYKEAVIVRVVECEKHPDADRLSVCKIDAGDGELVQVVCGAPNVHADMWAVWLPPESIVPSTYDTADEFKLGARELRGVMSNGMLAAGDELAINDDHDGIVEITEWDLPEGASLQPGANFAKIFGLDDTIIDIENKMFTHRPDLFGQMGVAREISAILKGLPDESEANPDTRYENADWYWSTPQFAEAEGLELEVFNEAGEQVPRFMAVAMKNVTIAPSPLWLQTTLVRWGSKAINNVVDLTNYIMLLTAQPTHAYDYAKLRGHKLGARMARNGEKATLLNGKTYTLSSDDIVISDGEGVVGLGGVMGGYESEVEATTTDIVLEVATFDMYAVRKSSMRYGLFTDALTRFNKGQSPLQNDSILHYMMQLMSEYAGAQQASAVHDTPVGVYRNVDSLSGAMRVSAEFINTRLGLTLTSDQIGHLLRRTNFAVYPPEDDASTLEITAPFWRTDIVDPEDIVEEVGRLYGFDKLPRELPQRSITPPAKNPNFEIKQLVRGSLARAGGNEVLTYSFVHEKTMQRAEQDVSQAFQLSNALSPDLQYYRLSVLPSLLDKVHMNIKAGHDEFVLFEIGKGHNKKYHADDDDGLPKELEFVDAVYASKKSREGAAYYHVRRLLDQLAHDLGLSIVYKPITESLDFPVTAPFDQTRSALVETTDGTFIGMIGELKQTVLHNFKLPSYAAASTLDLSGLRIAHAATTHPYAPLSRYPSITQDVSLQIAQDMSYQTVLDRLRGELKVAEDVDIEVAPVTIYQASADAQVKTVTFRIRVTSHERTLTGDEVNTLIQEVTSKTCASLDAHVV